MRLAVSLGRAALALGWLLALVFAPLLNAAPSREYDVKAAFLYNFATFAEWPADAFEKPDSPFVIGVLGDDPFGPVLDQIVSGERIRNRPLVVQRFKRVEDVQRCQILFISASEARRMADIMRRLHGQPVLTVSDLPAFTEAGGTISFITTTRIGLKINSSSAQAGRIAISSKLLRLAQVVEETPLLRR